MPQPMVPGTVQLLLPLYEVFVTVVAVAVVVGRRIVLLLPRVCCCDHEYTVYDSHYFTRRVFVLMTCEEIFS